MWSSRSAACLWPAPAWACGHCCVGGVLSPLLCASLLAALHPKPASCGPWLCTCEGRWSCPPWLPPCPHHPWQRKWGAGTMCQNLEQHWVGHSSHHSRLLWVSSPSLLASPSPAGSLASSPSSLWRVPERGGDQGRGQLRGAFCPQRGSAGAGVCWPTGYGPIPLPQVLRGQQGSCPSWPAGSASCLLPGPQLTCSAWLFCLSRWVCSP